MILIYIPLYSDADVKHRHSRHYCQAVERG